MSQNPKQNSEHPRLSLFSMINDLCTNCGDCLPICPTKSIFALGDIHAIDADTCEMCHVCFSVCQVNAIQTIDPNPSPKQ